MTKIKCGECGETYHIKKKNIFDGKNWNFDYLMELGWRAVSNKDGDGGHYICPKCRKELENKNLSKKELEKKMIEVKHGIIEFDDRGAFCCVHRRSQSMSLRLPRKFMDLLRRFAKSTKRNKLEFSYAYDDEEHYSAIAIVHPKDYFNRKIGRRIVEGRILRMKGLIPNRKSYYPIPEWISLGDV